MKRTFYAHLPFIGELYAEHDRNRVPGPFEIIKEGRETAIYVGRFLIQNSRTNRDRFNARALWLLVVLFAACYATVTHFYEDNLICRPTERTFTR